MARATRDIAEGRAAVESSQLLLEQLAAAKPWRSEIVEAARQRHLTPKADLEITAQELALEIVEACLAEGRVVRRDDAASRHAADEVDGGEQVAAPIVP